jgi:hypothetical protein
MRLVQHTNGYKVFYGLIKTLISVWQEVYGKNFKVLVYDPQSYTLK